MSPPCGRGVMVIICRCSSIPLVGNDAITGSRIATPILVPAFSLPTRLLMLMLVPLLLLGSRGPIWLSVLLFQLSHGRHDGWRAHGIVVVVGKHASSSIG